MMKGFTRCAAHKKWLMLRRGSPQVQRLRRKWRRPKYKFWLGLFVSGMVLLFEVIPRTPAFAAKTAAAPTLPREEDIREAVVKGAQGYLNLPYIFGGAEPSGFDCSGLVFYLYNQQGFTMPRGTIAMRPTLKLTQNPKRGDVIFFRNDNNVAGHVGIFIDEERFIHAPQEGSVIRYDKLANPYWKKRFIEIRSVL